MSNGFPSMMYV